MANSAILVVDDDPAMLRLVSMIVGHGGNRPICAAGVAEALDVLAEEEVDLVLTDLNMPALGGLDLLAALSARLDSPPAIVVSGCTDAATLRAARLLGVREVVEKPFAVEGLRRAIDAALRSRRRVLLAA
jgi:DNA-binding NtrC family response regulator